MEGEHVRVNRVRKQVDETNYGVPGHLVRTVWVYDVWRDFLAPTQWLVIDCLARLTLIINVFFDFNRPVILHR